MIGALLAYLRDGFQIVAIVENSFSFTRDWQWQLQRVTLKTGVETHYVALPDGWVKPQ